MTDNTQAELEDILDTLAEKSADSDSRLGYVDAYVFAQEAKQAILDWHNKQVEEVLDRLTVADNISDRACSEAIQAERNKLKEVV